MLCESHDRLLPVVMPALFLTTRGCLLPAFVCAMSGRQFWVQRDEGVCRKRCREIQNILAESWPATKKFRDIFSLMDMYTDDDSDVALLDGVPIPKSGPVCIPAAVMAGASEASLGSFGCKFDQLAPAAPPPLPQTSAPSTGTAATSSEAPATVAKSSPHAAMIEQQRQRALERRAQMSTLQPTTGNQMEIFESQQWLP